MPYSPPALVVSPLTVRFGRVPWEGGEAHPRFLHVTLDTRIFPRRALPHMRGTGDVNIALLSETGTDAHHVLQTYRLTLKSEDPGPVDTCVYVYPSEGVGHPISWTQANALMGNNMVAVTGTVLYTVYRNVFPLAIDFGTVTFGKGAQTYFSLTQRRPALQRAVNIRANFTPYNSDAPPIAAPVSAPVPAQKQDNFYSSTARSLSPFVTFLSEIGMSSMNSDDMIWGIRISPTAPLGPFRTAIVVTSGKKNWTLPVTATIVPASR